jgi:hypothetical protein
VIGINIVMFMSDLDEDWLGNWIYGTQAAPPYKSSVRTANKTPLSAVLSVFVLNSPGGGYVTVAYFRSCGLAVAVVALLVSRSLSSNGCIRHSITS